MAASTINQQPMAVFITKETNMLKFVIPQHGSTTIKLHQYGATRPLVFGASVVAAGVDLRKYTDAQPWCPAHRIVEGVDKPVIPDSHAGLYDEASLANAYIIPFMIWLGGGDHQVMRCVEGWKLRPDIEDEYPHRQMCLGLADLIAHKTLMHAHPLLRDTQLPEGCSIVRTTRTVPHYILDLLHEVHGTGAVYTCYTTPYSPIHQELISVLTDEKFNVIRYRKGHRLNKVTHTTCTPPQYGVQTTVEYVFPEVTTVDWAAGQPVQVTHRDLSNVVEMFETNPLPWSSITGGASSVDIAGTLDILEDAGKSKLEYGGTVFCVPRGMQSLSVDAVAARHVHAPKLQITHQDPPNLADLVTAFSLQYGLLTSPKTSKGAFDLGALQPGLEWYDLDIDNVPLNDSIREHFAVEAGCNAAVLKWAQVPETDENVWAARPPFAVFEFAANLIRTR